jgi:transposase-like protein
MQKKPNDTEPAPLEAEKARRARKFTPESKAGAARLVTEDGRTFAGAAAALGVAKSSIIRGSQEAKAGRGEGPPGAVTPLARDTKENG